MDYSKYSTGELCEILDSLAFIQECIFFTVAETSRDTKSTDYLWSGLILKESIKSVTRAIREKSA